MRVGSDNVGPATSATTTRRLTCSSDNRLLVAEGRGNGTTEPAPKAPARCSSGHVPEVR